MSTPCLGWRYRSRLRLRPRHQMVIEALERRAEPRPLISCMGSSLEEHEVAQNFTAACRDPCQGQRSLLQQISCRTDIPRLFGRPGHGVHKGKCRNKVENVGRQHKRTGLKLLWYSHTLLIRCAIVNVARYGTGMGKPSTKCS
jgi:hypothetical protein